MKPALKNTIYRYLTDNHIMVLATAQNNIPWSSTVYFVSDRALNIYWASIPSRRHSQEIISNPNVSVAIPINYKINEKVIGLQGEGKASVLTDKPSVKKIAKLYSEKFNRDPKWVDQITKGQTEHKIFIFKPKKYVLFDEVNYPSNTKLELEF